VKTAALVAVPPGVVIAIFPVFAPVVGTVAVTLGVILNTAPSLFAPPAEVVQAVLAQSDDSMFAYEFLKV
jgi:hypothetical protein